MNQKKMEKKIKSAYQIMDEENRKKMEEIANGLLNVQMLVDEKISKSWVKSKHSRMAIKIRTILSDTTLWLLRSRK